MCTMNKQEKLCYEDQICQEGKSWYKSKGPGSVHLLDNHFVDTDGKSVWHKMWMLGNTFYLTDGQENGTVSRSGVQECGHESNGLVDGKTSSLLGRRMDGFLDGKISISQMERLVVFSVQRCMD